MSSGIRYKGELLGKATSTATSKVSHSAAKRGMEKCPIPHLPLLGELHLTRPQSLMLFGFVTFGVILYGVFNEHCRRAKGIADAEKKILADQKNLEELIAKKKGGEGRKEGTSDCTLPYPGPKGSRSATGPWTGGEGLPPRHCAARGRAHLGAGAKPRCGEKASRAPGPLRPGGQLGKAVPVWQW